MLRHATTWQCRIDDGEANVVYAFATLVEGVHDLPRQAAQQRQLRLEYRMGADEECAFVGAAESSSPAAGKNGRCPGNILIRT